MTRFLNSDLGSKELWRLVKKTVRWYESDDGILIFDTIAEKPYSDEGKINCCHYSHGKGAYLQVINILSSMVRYGEMTIPICYGVIHKEVYYSDLETQRTRRRSGVTKNELMRKLILWAKIRQVKFRYIMADSWYGTKENMNFIHQE